MIITCPHCQTKYQVAFDAIGSVGRKVQCAHCRRAWQQGPMEPEAPPPIDDKVASEADRLFDAMAEDALDEAMAAEEAAARVEPAPVRPPPPEKPPAASASDPGPAKPAAAAPKQNAPRTKTQQAAFSRRQNAMFSRLPMARLRRATRISGAIILVALLTGGYFGRMQIVENYPDLAGAYAAVGLGVNVVGLDFAGVQTLKTLSGGQDVLSVSAQIVGLSAKPMRVPPVVVSLLDAKGRPVYEWSVSPQVRDLMAGERATFDTRLSLPPSEAESVRLRFAGGGGEAADEPGSAAAETASGPVESQAESDAAGHEAEAAPADGTGHETPAPAPAAAAETHH